jgi:hypothetical protein
MHPDPTAEPERPEPEATSTTSTPDETPEPARGASGWVEA